MAVSGRCCAAPVAASRKSAQMRGKVCLIFSPTETCKTIAWSPPDYVSSGVETNRAGMRFEVSQGIRLRITLESLQHLRIARQFFRRRNFRATRTRATRHSRHELSYVGLCRHYRGDSNVVSLFEVEAMFISQK